MTHSINTLSTIPLEQLLPEIDITTDDIDQVLSPSNQSRVINGNGRITILMPKDCYALYIFLFVIVYSDGLIVLYFGQKDSLLKSVLVEYLICQDVTLILLSTEEQLWNWLNRYSSLRIASLIIETNINIEDIMSRSSGYDSIRSILIRCSPTELIRLKQFSRSYMKIDGIFADDTRILIKLCIDLALFSEELGDQQREDELNAQRHYDRALYLCSLVKTL